MFTLYGWLTIYVVLGILIVPHIDPTVAKFDFKAFFANIAWAFVWPIKVITWFKNRNKTP